MWLLGLFWVKKRAIWLRFTDYSETEKTITERIDLDVAYWAVDSNSGMFARRFLAVAHLYNE
jgi:hypothetical protein